MCGETESPAGRHRAAQQRSGEVWIATEQTERRAEKERESRRHTAGRWRSPRAPGQPCDEDSGEGDRGSPRYVRIVMRRWSGVVVDGGGGGGGPRQRREEEEKNQPVSQKEGKESK